MYHAEQQTSRSILLNSSAAGGPRRDIHKCARFDRDPAWVRPNFTKPFVTFDRATASVLHANDETKLHRLTIHETVKGNTKVAEQW